MKRLVVVCVLAVGLPVGASAQAVEAVPIDMRGCRYVEVVARAPITSVRPLVPAELQPNAGGGLAQILLGGAVCEQATSGTTTGTARFGWTSVVLNPPLDPELRGTGIRVFLYRLEHFLVPGDIYAQVADAVGAERITLDAIDASSDPPLANLSLRADGFEHRAVGGGSLPVEPMPCCQTRWREFGSVAGGFAMLEATLSGGGSGGTLAGSIFTSPGSVAERVLGSSAAGFMTRGHALGALDGYMAFISR